MQNNDTRSITIVGGGSSGWMTALYLNTLFNRQRRNYSIRVIESPDIGIIGVGEATVHSVRFFFAAMGLDESELLRETHGSLKLGILVRNWKKPVNGRTHEYFHPFECSFPFHCELLGRPLVAKYHRDLVDSLIQVEKSLRRRNLHQ